MNDFSIIVPTLNGLPCLEKLLLALRCYSGETLVVDSGSTDGTIELVRDLGVRLIQIKMSDFNHGATREFARKQVDSRVVLFMTQDAIPSNPKSIDSLVHPVLSGEVDIAYGRQLCSERAGIFESFPRKFNYPADGNQRSINDVDEFGVYTFFCSDSFSAYSQKSLDSVGGFQSWYTNEDYLITAKILVNGGNIRYVADATVSHSHAYTLIEEFKRNFDNGHVRGMNPWVSNLVGSVEKRGLAFLKALLKQLWRTKPFLIPYAIIQTGVKWLGFKVGFHSTSWPRPVKKICSGQSYYFDSKYYVSGKN